MTISVNQFRANLKSHVDKTIHEHEALTVNRKNGDAFVVMSLEDYNREQETLYVLENSALMKQIEASLATYQSKSGYTPNEDVLNLDEYEE